MGTVTAFPTREPKPRDWIDDLPVLRLTRQEFLALGEYSCSMPSGTTTGKRWKRLDGVYHRKVGGNRKGPPARWVIGEYGEPFTKNGRELIEVKWYRPIITVRAMVEITYPVISVEAARLYHKYVAHCQYNRKAIDTPDTWDQLLLDPDVNSRTITHFYTLAKQGLERRYGGN